MKSSIPSARIKRSGWPWESITRQQSAATMPLISIVTPSYNQAAFLEETIRSVLLQQYPNLEYIIIDGGSVDGSVEIIETYAPHLTHWESAVDNGQSDAINKGLTHANGSIVAWLNSDDYLLPDALFKVAKAWREHPAAALIYGLAPYTDTDSAIDYDGQKLGRKKTGEWDYARLLERCYLSQPATFINTDVTGPVQLDQSLHYALDWELWLRLGLMGDGHFIDEPLAAYRLWEASKTMSQPAAFKQERHAILQRLANDPAFSAELQQPLKHAIARLHLQEAEQQRKSGRLVQSLPHYTRAARYSPRETLRRLIRAH